MKDTEHLSPHEIRALLDNAEKYLAKNEFAQAEKFANKALASPHAALVHCILGSCCANTGRAAGALKHYQNAFAAAQTEGNLSLQARALNGIAILQRSDQDTAIRTAERALAFAEQAPDKTQHAKALNILGSLHTDAANYPRGLEYYTQALTHAEEIDDRQSVAAYLGNIGNVHRILGDYTLALDYFRRALAISEQISNTIFIQRNLHLIGEVYSGLADHVRALDYLGHALALAEQLGHKANVANLYISIGIVHSSLADYARALDYYSRALAITEETGDKYGFAACLDNIGTVYWNLVDYPRAMEYFSRALAVAEEIGAKTLIANNLGNTGIVYKDNGNYVRSLEYLRRALHLSEETGDRSQTSHWMQGIASAERKLGHFDAAHQGFLDTLHYQRDVLVTNEGVAETLFELGGLLREQGKIEEGLARFMESLHLAETLGEKKYAAQAHKEIAYVFSTAGNMEKAFEHFTQYHALDKEVFSEESQKRFELYHLRKAVADKEREAELQRLRADRSEHDLANRTMQLLAQSELLSKFRDDMFEIVRRIPSTQPARADSTVVWEPALRELKAKLKELPSKSVDWARFEAQFTNAHPDFKTQLLEKYPELTKQEVKMCQLARLGVKTGEMAQLLCLSERTIDSHRLNLRKKIGLNKDQSLTKFLTEMR